MAQEYKHSFNGRMKISAGYKPGNMAAFMYGGTKPTRKKKQKKHKKSILKTRKGVCYLCSRLNGDYRIKYTEEHHILYGGGRRTRAEGEGIKVYLCIPHHREGQQAVHANREIRELLCRTAQEEYEQTHTRDEWMEIAGKNYL